MPISFTCRTCETAYRLPDSMVGESGLRVRCARCKSVFEVRRGAYGPPPDDLPGPSVGPVHARASLQQHPPAGGAAQTRPDDLPGGTVGPGEAGSRSRGAPFPPAEPAWPGGGAHAPEREYDLGPLPVDADLRLEPTLGEVASGAAGPGVLRETSPAPWRDGPGSFGIGGRRLPGGPPPLPIRRPPPPAATGRRAFLAGLLGVTGLAVAGRLSWGAWRGRDWVALLSGDPFEVRVERRRTLTGRAGPLYVVDGSIRNLSGTPKGFFEVHGRLVGPDGETLAERVVYAGTVLPEPELKGLTRAELDRRFRQAVLGEHMANTHVEPRRQVPFQIVFVPAPPAARIAQTEVEVVGAKDVP